MTCIHYVLLRCQPGRVFFREDAEYVSLRQRLVEQLKNEDQLLDYCLTTTEIRLLIALREDYAPGRFVQSHFSDWLRSLNRRDRLRGYVLAERARTRPIENASDLRRVVCFLARYPVDEGLAATPSAYRYGGHRSHIGVEPAAGLGVRRVLSFFGPSILEGREQLRQAVRSFEASEAEATALRIVHSGRPRPTTRERTQPGVNGKPLAIAQGDTLSQLISDAERELCSRHEMPPMALFARPAPPGAAVLRSVIVHILTSAKLLRIADLARRYQRAPQTLKGEMQRHRHDPASAGYFTVTLEDLLGPDLWDRISLPAPTRDHPASNH